jgi:hypothetical protein
MIGLIHQEPLELWDSNPTPILVKELESLKAFKEKISLN